MYASLPVAQRAAAAPQPESGKRRAAAGVAVLAAALLACSAALGSFDAAPPSPSSSSSSAAAAAAALDVSSPFETDSAPGGPESMTNDEISVMGTTDDASNATDDGGIAIVSSTSASSDGKNPKDETTSGSSSSGSSSSSTDALSITFSNAYERDILGHQLADGEGPWKHLVQINQLTEAKVDSPTTGCLYEWNMPDGSILHGDAVEHTFAVKGSHSIRLKEACTGSDSTYFDLTVMVKYVRYEIRSLTAEDRSAFFDALEHVYKTSQTEGEKRWGSKFRSAASLVREHLLGAADKMCDHWHDDAGILTHHMGFTLELEQSLQSINANVSVAYWDYTLDALMYANDWTLSPIFDDDWFGKASPESTDHIITTGRWAYLTVEKLTTDVAGFSKVHNPYNLLRSPWNTNPTPYVTRYRYVDGLMDGGWALPNCMQFQQAAKLDWIGDIFSVLNGELHGPIHVMIGGQWAFNKHLNVSTGLNELGVTQISTAFLLSSKFLWRQGIVRCPEYCSDDTPSRDCTCSCPATTLAGRTAYEVMNETGLFDFVDIFDNSTKLAALGLNFGTLLELICHVGHAGEAFTSAAPYDPTFWPLHGVAERFLAYKRIAAANGKTTLNETWGYRHDDIASDTHRVCDWSNVTGMELPTCVKETCPGHHEWDVLPMGNFLDRGETYTNRQFYELTWPYNDDLPYVYDSYSVWPACSMQNMTFY